LLHIYGKAALSCQQEAAVLCVYQLHPAAVSMEDFLQCIQCRFQKLLPVAGEGEGLCKFVDVGEDCSGLNG
jgi:hypothetical protein